MFKLVKSDFFTQDHIENEVNLITYTPLYQLLLKRKRQNVLQSEQFCENT